MKKLFALLIFSLASFSFAAECESTTRYKGHGENKSNLTGESVKFSVEFEMKTQEDGSVQAVATRMMGSMTSSMSVTFVPTGNDIFDIMQDGAKIGVMNTMGDISQAEYTFYSKIFGMTVQVSEVIANMEEDLHKSGILKKIKDGEVVETIYYVESLKKQANTCSI